MIFGMAYVDPTGGGMLLQLLLGGSAAFYVIRRLFGQWFHRLFRRRKGDDGNPS